MTTYQAFVTGFPLTKMRRDGRPICCRYSAALSLSPNIPTVCPTVEYPNSDRINSWTPAALAASASKFWPDIAAWPTVETTTSILFSLKVLVSAFTSVMSTVTALTPLGNLADDPGRVTTMTLAPLLTSCCSERSIVNSLKKALRDSQLQRAPQ